MHHTTHAWKTLSSVEGQRSRTPKASTMSTASVPDHLRNESGFDAKLPDKKRHNVPEWLRNESGVENKSTGKRRRKDVASDNMMKTWMNIFEESRKNRQDFTSQILARFDAIESNINIASDNMMKKCEESQQNRQELTSQIPATNAPNVPKLKETDMLFAEHSRIIDAEKQITADVSMSASMRNNMVKVLNIQREKLDAKFVAYNDKKKRKASEKSGTCS
jgi:hypothetical protein